MKETALPGTRVRYGGYAITFPNGRTLHLKGRGDGPQADIRLNRWRAVWRFMRSGAVGLGESYMDGDWDSPDLSTLIEVGARNLPERPNICRRLSPWRISDRIRHALRPNTRAGSARNISAHYDLGNDFYALWLDPSMTYSAAVFSGGEKPAAARPDRSPAGRQNSRDRMRMGRLCDPGGPGAGPPRHGAYDQPGPVCGGQKARGRSRADGPRRHPAS